MGKNGTQSCFGTNDEYNQTRYWVGYHDGLRDGKKGVGREYNNANCGWNMQCTPYERGSAEFWVKQLQLLLPDY